MSSNKKTIFKNHRVDNQLDPYQSLANAIIHQAITDYRGADKKLSENPKDSTAQHTHNECLKFFHSRWFGVLTDVRPEILVERLREEKKYLMMRVALRKLYESIALRRAVQGCAGCSNQ